MPLFDVFNPSVAVFPFALCAVFLEELSCDLPLWFGVPLIVFEEFLEIGDVDLSCPSVLTGA